MLLKPLLISFLGGFCSVPRIIFASVAVSCGFGFGLGRTIFAGMQRKAHAAAPVRLAHVAPVPAAARAVRRLGNQRDAMKRRCRQAGPARRRHHSPSRYARAQKRRCHAARAFFTWPMATLPAEERPGCPHAHGPPHPIVVWPRPCPLSSRHGE